MDVGPLRVFLTKTTVTEVEMLKLQLLQLKQKMEMMERFGISRAKEWLYESIFAASESDTKREIAKLNNDIRGYFYWFSVDSSL